MFLHSVSVALYICQHVVRLRGCRPWCLQSLLYHKRALIKCLRHSFTIVVVVIVSFEGLHCWHVALMVHFLSRWFVLTRQTSLFAFANTPPTSTCKNTDKAVWPVRHVGWFSSCCWQVGADIRYKPVINKLWSNILWTMHLSKIHLYFYNL